MSLQIQLKKSAVSQKQPFASDLAVGELALNYNADGPFLTCKDTEGNVRKLNNVWVAAAAPTNPTAGDLWLDTNLTTAVLKVYKDSTSGWVNATTIPVATTSIFGTVRLATSSDITNGTSGKVVDAAQLQSKITDLLSNDVVLNGDLEVNGDLTVNGTTTTIDTETLIVEDKNIEMGVVATPTDNTADGGGITLKGATDKTLNWVNATDSWTSSENLDLASGKSYRINGTEVLSATALGSAVQISSANIPNGTIVDSDINAAAEIAVSKLADGDARQLLQTDAAGTGVEWTSNVDVPGTLDVTGAATFDSSVAVTGTLTKSGNNVVTVGDTGTVTSTMIANNTIVNEDINASAAIADTKLDTISTAGKVSNSATTATSANTASAIVARDASGNFTAGTVTASLTGNADTATKLNSTRTFAVTGDVTGTVSSDLTSGATIATSIASGVIVDADINASAEIAVSKLADGDARQLLQTDAAGTGVEWTSNVDVPGTLDVTGATTLDSTLGVTGVISANGKVSFPLGSAAAPSLYPGSDTNTGIYSPGADQLAISTNGTQRLLIDSSGNVNIDSNTLYVDATNNRVGLGTSSPSAVLDVSGNSKTSTLQIGTNPAGVNIGVLGIPNQKRIYGRNVANTADVNILYINGSNGMVFGPGDNAVIDSSGRLGIGTTSPGSALEINAAAATSPFIAKINTAEAARIDSSGRLLVGTSSATAISGSIASRAEFQSTSVEYSQSLIRHGGTTAANGTFLLLGRSRGTTANSVTAVANGDALGTIVFHGANGTDFSNQAASISALVDGEPFTSGDTTDLPGRLVLSTTADGASSPTERMRIDSSGRVGIGTTSPSEKLEVAGDAVFGSSGAASKVYLRRPTDGAYISYIGFTSAVTNDAFVVKNGSGNGNVILEGNGGNIIFNTSAATERARIDSSGTLLVGTSSALGNERLNVDGRYITQTATKLLGVNGSGNNTLTLSLPSVKHIAGHLYVSSSPEVANKGTVSIYKVFIQTISGQTGISTLTLEQTVDSVVSAGIAVSLSNRVITVTNTELGYNNNCRMVFHGMASN